MIELMKVNNLLLEALMDLTRFCEGNNINCELELAKEAINKALTFKNTEHTKTFIGENWECLRTQQEIEDNAKLLMVKVLNYLNNCGGLGLKSIYLLKMFSKRQNVFSRKLTKIYTCIKL